jgi:hypothetical protein
MYYDQSYTCVPPLAEAAAAPIDLITSAQDRSIRSVFIDKNCTSATTCSLFKPVRLMSQRSAKLMNIVKAMESACFPG